MEVRYLDFPESGVYWFCSKHIVKAHNPNTSPPIEVHPSVHKEGIYTQCDYIENGKRCAMLGWKMLFSPGWRSSY